MWKSFLLLNLIVIIVIKLYTRLTCGLCKSSKHLVGKVVIVTGANTGIGFETANNLAERGAKVILACRNETRALEACKKIREATGNEDVHYKHLDYTSLKSVREFATDINANEERIDILINNAGGYIFGKKDTEDGLLLGMQTNYFGPFLLTNLLLPKLKASAPSRVINVSSMLHTRANVKLDDLNYTNVSEKDFQDHNVYSTSKLCNVLMSNELSRRLQGSGVTSNAVDPGSVKTDILNECNSLFLWVSHKFVWLFGKDCWEGAQTQIYLAVAPEVEGLSGRYFKDCKEHNMSMKAEDEEVAKLLWNKSKKLVGLK